MADVELIAPALLVDEGLSSEGIDQVLVHPIVLLQILDHHTRRPHENGRVIGTLLGQRYGNTVELTNCFAVPHAESGDDVAIGKDYNKTMLNLHLRMNRKETVVGWYASASSDDDGSNLIRDTSSLIHEFYATEAEEGDPIHLLVDTRLRDERVPLKAYRNSQLFLQNDHVGNMFHEIKVALKHTEAEAICMHELIAADKEIVGKEKDEKRGLVEAMEQLNAFLDNTLTYVNDVVDGKVKADAHMGRKIADSLSTIPSLNGDVADGLFHDSLQDLLTVSYLSNITRTQLAISEKLNASLGAAPSKN